MNTQVLRRSIACLSGLLLVVLVVGCNRGGEEGTTVSEATAPESTMSAASADEGTEPVDLDMDTVKAIVLEISSKIGERPAGSPKLKDTALWIAKRIDKLGYESRITDYELPNGETSHNVIAATEAEGPRLVLAAHTDTVLGCACANDDATGIGSMIEIARILKERGLSNEIPVQFVFLGAEEEIEGFEGHGYSAVKLLERLPPDEIDRMGAAVWLDKLGRGESFLALVIEGTSDAAAKMYLDAIEDPEGKPELKVVPRWSEKMAFEDHDIPTVWIEWSKDRHLHKPTDTFESIEWHRVAAAAEATLNLALSKSWMEE